MTTAPIQSSTSITNWLVEDVWDDTRLSRFMQRLHCGRGQLVREGNHLSGNCPTKGGGISCDAVYGKLSRVLERDKVGQSDGQRRDRWQQSPLVMTFILRRCRVQKGVISSCSCLGHSRKPNSHDVGIRNV